MKKLVKKRGQGKAMMTVNLLVDVQATLADLYKERHLSQYGRAMLVRASEKVWHVQAINNGLRTTDHKFNEHLLELLGEENLN